MQPELDLAQFEGRKRDHIRHSLEPAHQADGMSGLDGVRLQHEPLPELDLDEVRLETKCLGKKLKTPFFVAAMTMGHADAAVLNQRLARACEARGWAMGVGSQRRELEGRALPGEARSLRQAAPGAVLLANIGLSQIISGVSIDQVRQLVDSIEAQALVIHLNALQEVLQPEGTPSFRGGLAAIRGLCRKLHVPVVVKETGCGFSAYSLRRLLDSGVSAVDVSGLGGTHWGRIEGARSASAMRVSGGALGLQAAASRTFAGWGNSTVDSVRAAHALLSRSRKKGYSVWASGGVRSGLDAAKLIALGADRVGYAQPALKAALDGTEALDRWMELMEFELRIALFCTGSASPSRLKGRAVMPSGMARTKGNRS